VEESTGRGGDGAAGAAARQMGGGGEAVRMSRGWRGRGRGATRKGDVGSSR
jgi:hypothetical protein